MRGESFAQQWFVAGIVVALVVGTVGVGAVVGGPIGAEPTDDAPQAGTVGESEAEKSGAGDSSVRQDESDGNGSVITPNETIESLQAVENRTNGTVFRARLSGEPGNDLDRSEFVYELDVLAPNGSHIVAEVYAANATVISVEPANASDGFFTDLFGESDDVPGEVREAGDLRSATDAIRLAVDETDAAAENRTVTQVVLETQNETLVYRVQQFDPSGDPQEVVVAAESDADDAVTTDA